jgi:hypothetical protein
MIGFITFHFLPITYYLFRFSCFNHIGQNEYILISLMFSDIFCHEQLTKNCYLTLFCDFGKLIKRLPRNGSNLINTRFYLFFILLNIFGTMFDLTIPDLRKVKD